MKYDTIFFDIGNTLFFFNYEFLRDLLEERYAVSVPVQELEAKHHEARITLARDGLLGSVPHDKLWWEVYRRWLLSVGVEEELIKIVSESIRNHPFSHLFWSRMEEGMPRMLDWFRERGYKLGVISNAEGQIKRLIEHANLTDRFEVIVDSAEVGIVKPDERIFCHAMNEMGVKDPAQCIHVGDIFDIDVVGARNAGITPVLVDKDGLFSDASCMIVKSALELPKLQIFSE